MKPGKSYDKHRESLRQVLLSSARMLEVSAEDASDGHMNTVLQMHKSIFDKFDMLSHDGRLPPAYEMQAMYHRMLSFMSELVDEVRMARPEFMQTKTIEEFNVIDTNQVLTEVLVELKRRHNVMMTGETAVKHAQQQASEAHKEAEEYRKENLALLDRNDQLHDMILGLERRLNSSVFNTFSVPD